MPERPASLRCTELRCSELFEAHGRHVRALARALVGSGPDADDVVQETWLAALRRPPRRRGDLRAWLATLVRNVVRQGRRAGDRRRHHERAAPGPERDGASPAQLVERADLQRRMVETVLGLPEPMRSTLLMRYFDGVGPRAIAAREGVPLETVRTRLRRGLRRLRAELDEAHGCERDAWLPLAVAIAGPAPVAIPVTLATGVIVMSMQAKLATAAAVVLTVVGGMLLATGDGPAPVELGGVTDRDASAPRAADAGAREPAAMTRDAERAMHAAPLPRLRGIVVGLRPGVPLTAPVRLDAKLDAPGAQPGPLVRTAAVASDGTFVFEVPPWVTADVSDAGARTVRLALDDPRYLPGAREVAAPELAHTDERPVRLEVACAGVLRGTVTDADGSPAAGALVTAHAFEGDFPGVEPAAVTRTSSDGSYALRIADDGEQLIVASPELPVPSAEPGEGGGVARQPAAARATALVGARIDVAPIRLERPVAVTGRVTWLDGTAVAGALVHASSEVVRAELRPGAVELAWLGGERVVLGNALATTGADGRFTIDGLCAAPTALGIQWIGADPVRADGLERTVTPPAQVDFVIDAVRVRVVVTDGARPLAGARLRVRHGSVVVTTSTEGGRRQLVLGGGRRFGIRAEAPGHVARELEWTPPSDRSSADLEVALVPRATHALRVAVDPGIDRARFSLRPLDRDDGSIAVEAQAAGGVFTLEDVPPGRYALTFGRPQEPGADNWVVERAVEVSVPSNEPLSLRGAVQGGRIRVRCTDDAGRFVAASCRIESVGGGRVPTSFRIGKPGSLAIGAGDGIMPGDPNETNRNLPPGDYVVRVATEGLAWRSEVVKVRAREVTEVAFRF